MNKTILGTGALLGLLAVILGAFAAHGLKTVVEAAAVSTFEVGVRYQMYHAFFLFVLGLIPSVKENKKKVIYILVLVGVLFFSGSIYVLALNALTGFDFTTIGFITPIGGLLMIIAWGILLFQIISKK